MRIIFHTKEQSKINNNVIIHSAKGTSWEKKDHKYLRKEGDVYIYEETKPEQSSGPNTIHDNPITRATNAEYEKMVQEKMENQGTNFFNTPIADLIKIGKGKYNGKKAEAMSEKYKESAEVLSKSVTQYNNDENRALKEKINDFVNLSEYYHKLASEKMLNRDKIKVINEIEEIEKKYKEK